MNVCLNAKFATKEIFAIHVNLIAITKIIQGKYVIVLVNFVNLTMERHALIALETNGIQRARGVAPAAQIV